MMSPKIKVGIAGWSYPGWRGIVYPDAKTDMLSYAAQFVDVIEINSTFYRPALSEDSRSWVDRTSQSNDFCFTAKLHQSFTHRGFFDESLTSRLKEGLVPLLEAGKLHRLLAQFHDRFSDTADNRLRLEKIAGLFSNYCPLAFELRHKSWHKPEALEFLRGLQVSLCDSDYVNREPHELLGHKHVGQHGYFRLYGPNREKRFGAASADQTRDLFYTANELQELLSAIERAAQGCQTYTLIAVNHYKGAELANAIQIKAMLTGTKRRFPELLLIEYPDLIEYAQNALLI